MKNHEDLTDAHVPYRWTYETSVLRLAATGFVTSDIGKLSKQSDDNSLWMLTEITPTWKAVGGSISSRARENDPMPTTLMTFKGANGTSVEVNDHGSGEVEVFIDGSTSGGGGGVDGHVIKSQDDGTLGQMPNLFFYGNVSVSNDNGDQRTMVNILGPRDEATICNHNLMAWTWVNQKTCTFEHISDACEVFVNPGVDSDDALSLRYEPIPAGNFRFTAHFALISSDPSDNMGILWGFFDQADTGKMMGLQSGMNGSVSVQKWTDNATYDAPVSGSNSPIRGNDIWLRITYDGLDKVFEYSLEGLYWVELFRCNWVDYMTPDSVFWGVIDKGYVIRNILYSYQLENL